MSANWYKNDNIENSLNRIKEFLSETPFSGEEKLVKFKNTLDEEDINTYVPFDRYSYDNTEGISGEISDEVEILKFKRQLKIKNRPPKTNDYYYFYLLLNDTIIGKANCRVSLSKFPTLYFDFLFVSNEYTNLNYGKKLFFHAIHEISKSNEINSIKAQALSINNPALRILNSLDFII